MEAVAGLVSVVTPCRDGRAFVGDAMRAVLAQTYSPVEHVVVDDGSTDGSWEVIASFGDRVVGVRLERGRGGAHARNRGAALARGEYLMFLDADDTLAPDTLAALVAALAHGGDVAACAWQGLRLGRTGWRAVGARTAPPGPAEDPLAGWLEGRWLPPCALLWRRAAYEAVGGWDESLRANQDGDLMLRALAAGRRIVPAGGGTAFYRDHGATVPRVGSDHADLDKLRSRMRVLEKLRAQLARSGTLAPYRRSLGIAYHRLAFTALAASPELSEYCLALGRAYAGGVDVSRTGPGRLLERLVGMRRKERLLEWLADAGLASAARRHVRARRRAGLGNAAGAGGAETP